MKRWTQQPKPYIFYRSVFNNKINIQILFMEYIMKCFVDVGEGVIIISIENKISQPR